jgi:hypothetical protein
MCISRKLFCAAYGFEPPALVEAGGECCEAMQEAGHV